MLEEVEVPIPFGHGIVRRMRALDAGNGKPATGNEIDGDVQVFFPASKSTTWTYHGSTMPRAASNSLVLMLVLSCVVQKAADATQHAPLMSPWPDAIRRRIQPWRSVLPDSRRQGFAPPGCARP